MTINNIFYVILSIISVLITGVLIPYLKNKNAQNKTENILNSVEIAVKAAEQIYKESGKGELKKEYVLRRLQEMGLKLSEKELDDMIEASVLELNKWKKELKN
ncbi:phage holin [Peptoniphilus sp. AGMB00490]|uniref:Phage holin n=1 Tax=Peptoniphilus faecalis TaxID=2731255 RepID=A0A848RN02_9FIRM|nr:phage holin [Peptoniphilus faecalis]NMW85514.1 phage holin [Peptoniphilus faecalis]